MTTRLPALGLEGTAARILAECAAREEQVDPWEASLPDPMTREPWSSDRFASALCDISHALVHVDDNPIWALDRVREAAADVRAWRLSLPEDQRGAPIALTARYSVRNALCRAAYFLVNADLSGGLVRGHYLRDSEAFLRIAGEVLIAQGAE